MFGTPKCLNPVQLSTNVNTSGLKWGGVLRLPSLDTESDEGEQSVLGASFSSQNEG